jgi:hypothetical protein
VPKDPAIRLRYPERASITNRHAGFFLITPQSMATRILGNRQGGSGGDNDGHGQQPSSQSPGQQSAQPRRVHSRAISLGLRPVALPIWMASQAALSPDRIGQPLKVALIRGGECDECSIVVGERTQTERLPVRRRRLALHRPTDIQLGFDHH